MVVSGGIRFGVRVLWAVPASAALARGRHPAGGTGSCESVLEALCFVARLRRSLVPDIPGVEVAVIGAPDEARGSWVLSSDLLL